MEGIVIANLFFGSRMKASSASHMEAPETFSSILQDSVRRSSLSAKASSVKFRPRIGSLEESSSLSGTEELEDKYCSMCGSRIKEDGTCPICIVPVFISGNPGSHKSDSAICPFLSKESNL